MYYVLMENGVVKGNTITSISKKFKGKMENIEFKSCGADYICKLTEKDIDFIQDKKRMSMIPINKLYKKDSTITILLIINLVFTIILQFKK